MRICQYCSAPERPDDPVQDCAVNNEHYLVHRGCQGDCLKAIDSPALKVLGIAPGNKCDLCGSGRYVYLIQLPGEKEAAPRHRHCAGRYWGKKIASDNCTRHSSKDDYNCHIGSPEWKRFRCEVIKQRGNRCERCRQVTASLQLHHLHYRSLGSEHPEDVELLCPKCHTSADEARAAKSRPKQ
jgi:hypothetical protein